MSSPFQFNDALDLLLLILIRIWVMHTVQTVHIQMYATESVNTAYFNTIAIEFEIGKIILNSKPFSPHVCKYFWFILSET